MEQKKIENELEIKNILFPMLEILDNKNIKRGIEVSEFDDKFYVCFEQSCLSDTNRYILSQIAYVYHDIFFYSDNKISPMIDRCELFFPNIGFTKTKEKEKETLSKKLCVVELPIKDEIFSLGTLLSLANALKEQDSIFYHSKEDYERHDKYIQNGMPDKKWYYIDVYLNHDNALRKRMDTPFCVSSEINSIITRQNELNKDFKGLGDNMYITFTLERDILEKIIKEYFDKESYQKQK